MKQTIGIFSFISSLIFTIGLFIATASNAFGIGDERTGFCAFFGFGIPTLFLGYATLILWKDNKPYLRFLGVSCFIAGLIWAASLFCFVTSVIISSDVEVWETTGIFLSFGIPMFISTGAGISLLLDLYNERT